MVGHTFQKIYDISDDKNQPKELLLKVGNEKTSIFWVLIWVDVEV